MNRRQLLGALVTGVGGFSGCLSEDQPTSTDETTATTTDDSTGTTTEAGTDIQTATPTDTDVTVENIVARKAVTYEARLGSGGVLAADGRQYLIASLGGDTERLPEFGFETDGDEWDAGVPDIERTNTRSIAGRERPFVAFELPSPLTASNPTVRDRESGAEWSVPEPAQATLGAPGPRFELDTLDIPDSVSQGEQLSVSMTVRNVSETDGRFLAAVYWPTRAIADDDESHIVDRTVPAGETATPSLGIATSYTAVESGPVTLRVRGHVSANRDVLVRDVRE